MKIHRTLLVLLYVSGILLAAALAVDGLDYYRTPLAERPHMARHAELKPGGIIGHGLGILGSGLILLLFLYSLRRRNLLGLRFGDIGQWLNIHILFGIMGPIFVTLHTCFKFGGIVSVSFYSMVAVAASGFIGRYLYVQIPRTISGDELTLIEMEEKSREMGLLLEEYGMDEQLLAEVRAVSGARPRRRNALTVIPAIIFNDLARPFRRYGLKKRLRSQAAALTGEDSGKLMRIIDRHSLLVRKIEMLSSVQRLFHLWHVVHKPFATVMILIMMVHVTVAILFGYRWIF